MKFSELMVCVGGIFLAALVLYGCYSVAKKVSYTMFYEDLVIETIKTEVKKSCLK